MRLADSLVITGLSDNSKVTFSGGGNKQIFSLSGRVNYSHDFQYHADRRQCGYRRRHQMTTQNLTVNNMVITSSTATNGGAIALRQARLR